MKKKSLRLLALVLALVMLVSSSCVTAFAQYADYTQESSYHQDANGKYYFTYAQASSYTMDLIDDLLGTLNEGKDMYIDAKVTSWTLTLQSYDKALGSVKGMWDSTLISVAKTLGLAGDLKNINVSCLSGYPKRTDSGRYDYDCLYQLVHFLFDNRNNLKDIVTGDFGWGLIDNVVVLPELITDMDGFLAKTLYGVVEELMDKEPGSADTDTTYNENGTDVDRAVNELVVYFLNDKLGESLDFPGGLGLTTAQVSVNGNVSFYDVVNNIIESALNNLAVPLVKGLLMDALDMDYDEENPDGFASQLTELRGNMIYGLVTGILSEVCDDELPNLSHCTLPGEEIGELLQWFFDGGMDSLILIDNTGVTIGDGFVELLGKVAGLLPDLLSGLLEDASLPDEYRHSGENLTTNQQYAVILSTLFSSVVPGYYVNKDALSIAEVGAYALAALCARYTPEINYMDQLEANYVDGTYYDAEGHAVAPLDFIRSYNVVGQNISGTQITRTYKVPYACIDMGVEIGCFFLDGLITADFDAVPASNGNNATQRLEKFVKVLLDWAVDTYLPLFKTTYNLATKYPNASDVWKEIDEILFGLIPTSWLPNNITDHTMAATDTFDGLNGSATIPMACTADLICGWLVGSVMDLDFQQLFGILHRNTSANAEFNSNIMTVLLRVIDRVFYVALGKYALLPGNQGTRNAYTTPTTITHINNNNSSGLLYSNNLGDLVKYLIEGLSGGTTFNATSKLKPILETALPLIASADFMKPYTSNVSLGEIKVSDLQMLIDQVKNEQDYRYPYVVENNIDETTVGTYYTTTYNGSGVTFNPVVLNGVDNDLTKTYYTQKYVRADDVNERTNSASYNEGNGVFKLNEVYTAVTLDGSGAGYNKNTVYYDTSFVVASVDETTNGTYFSAQNASNAVTLPDNYNSNTTYYTHPIAAISASTEGTYYVKNQSYTAVSLNGNGGGFIANKKYYTLQMSGLKYTYLDSYDDVSGRLAMGIYTPNAGNAHGQGAYSTSITERAGQPFSQPFYIYFLAEDFQNSLFAYNQYKDFIKEAESFIDDYNDFIISTKKDADKWKTYFSTAGAKIPKDTNYPFYSLSYNDFPAKNGGYKSNVSTSNFNQLQAIVDYLATYGQGGFITSTTSKGDKSKVSSVTPLVGNLASQRNAPQTEEDVIIFKGYRNFIKDVISYSEKLNAYYDGINAYLTQAEAGRKSYTQTSVTQLKWAMKLAETAYNNGINGDGTEAGRAYTVSSYKKLKQAYQIAVAMVAQVESHLPNAKTTQSMVTEVRAGLINAFLGLKVAGNMADLTQLRAKIATALNILNDENSATIYTADSLAYLLRMQVAGSATVTAGYEEDEQSFVDAAAAKIDAAINALAYIALPSISTDVGGDESVGEGTDDNKVDPNSGVHYVYIYGLPLVIGLTLNGFSVNGFNPDRVAVAPSTYGTGTGAAINGTNLDGTTAFSYIAVVFGDVNGDARIDGVDKLIIERAALNNSGDNFKDYQLVAADVNGDGAVNVSDAADIQKVVNYEATIDQSAPTYENGVSVAKDRVITNG